MDIEKLPMKLRIGQKTGKPIANFSHVFKRLNRNEPSGTIVPGHNAFPVHPTLNRTLTVREAARIQTFPDNYKLIGNFIELEEDIDEEINFLTIEYHKLKDSKKIKKNDNIILNIYSSNIQAEII